MAGQENQQYTIWLTTVRTFRFFSKYQETAWMITVLSNCKDFENIHNNCLYQ